MMRLIRKTVWILPVMWFWIVGGTPAAFGGGLYSQKDYEDCIVRHAGRASSPQAAVILQRACFYKYRFGKDDTDFAGVSAEQKMLSRIYIPPVCDCLFEKMPAADPNVSGRTILKHCVERSQKAPEPSAQ